ncbi:MAG: hypothetical protein DRJ67_01030 [Thermoprotei archaeon]|nr:MAG: hypothetical protein DRJ67_01030 [Thermoprotei archaeon]
MSDERLIFKLELVKGETVEVTSLTELEFFLKTSPVIRVRAYRDGTPIFMGNMAPKDEAHAEWVMNKVKEALGMPRKEEAEAEETGEGR